MFKGISIKEELIKGRKKHLSPEDQLLEEVHRILAAKAFEESPIFQNLQSYNKSFELLEEEELDMDEVFTLEEIKAICIKYRLRFLDSQCYKGDIPYDAILKIKDLNATQGKRLKGCKILAPQEVFTLKDPNADPILFAPTTCGNYYLVHQWGRELKWYKRWMAFPLQSFETLFLSLMLFTLIVTLIIPTYLITLDHSADYWCGYRMAAYFHLLIFFSGLTVYTLFAFNKNFSGSVWQSQRQFE